MIKQMPVLFCKYLRNESLDLHEILFDGQLLSCELIIKFHEDPSTNACIQIVNMRSHILSQVCEFTICACVIAY